VFMVSKVFLPGMIERRAGSIVNVTSIAARIGGGGGSAHYGAAKGGVSSLTRGLAKEVAPYGIRVNGISPGFIETRFHASTPAERKAQLLTTIPLQRAGAAEDCVGAVLFLVSPGANYLTGEIIEINGGQLMD
jgi:3-oxoacyl-[acyl-carrier protein] reductase